MKLEDVKFDIIKVIPQDKDSKKLTLDWKIYEVEGIEVFKPFRGWLKEFTKELKEENCYGRLLDRYAIKTIRGLKKGDKIMVGNLFGMEEAKVTELDYKNKKGMAESKCNWYPLLFVQEQMGDLGERKAWITTMMLSKACVPLTLECTKEEK